MIEKKTFRLFELVIVLFTFLFFTFFHLCGFFDGLENKTLDWRYRTRAVQNTKAKVILILISDESLSRLGSWPLPRSYYANAIDKLASAGANLIAFDILFEDISTADQSGDKAFIDSCRRFGRVILPTVFSESLLYEDTTSKPVLFEEIRYPFPSLAEVAGGFGYVNADFDYLNPDGIIQKTFLVHKFENEWFPSFSMAIAEKATGQIVSITDGGVSIGGHIIPSIDLPPFKIHRNSWHSETGKAVYINYLGERFKEPFPTYDFADIIENSFDPAAFQDAIVFIGPSAVGLGDLHLTPHGLKPGVIAHANLLENILDWNFLKAPSMRWQVLIIGCLTLLAFLFLLWQNSFIASTLLFVICLLSYVFLCFEAFKTYFLILPITTPLLTAVFLYIVIRFVQLITNLKLANIILKKQNIDLDQKVQELTALHNAGSRFPAILEMPILSMEIIEKFCELRKADTGLLVYFDAKTGQPKPLGQVLGNRTESYIQNYLDELSSNLKKVFESKLILETPDSSLYTTYFPLVSRNTCWGAICLYEPPKEQSWQSEHFWVTLLGISCTALENARLYEMAREISLAKQVQANFLPQKQLKLNAYSVFGHSRPATQLGGDYFDYFVIDDRYLVIIIADVMGHGVPAALGMTIVKTSVLQRAKEEFSVEKLVDTINLTLMSSQKQRLMVTAQFTVIDTVEHKGTIFHRGHVFPFHTTDNGKWVQERCVIAPPLGVVKNSSTPGTSIEVLPGERWLFYTDGLYESLSENDENDMKINALQNYLESRPLLPITEACSDILDHHPSFLSGHPQPDDYTVLILERQLNES